MGGSFTLVQVAALLWNKWQTSVVYATTDKLNEEAVDHARDLIGSRQYVIDSIWNEVSPTADDENRFIDNNDWSAFGKWHLGLVEGATPETKSRYGFVFGDFRRLHRMGLIACRYRAAEHQHKDIELAAHELLQYLDKSRS